jgi:hypothetical protein
MSSGHSKVENFLRNHPATFLQTNRSIALQSDSSTNVFLFPITAAFVGGESVSRRRIVEARVMGEDCARRSRPEPVR